MPGWFVVSSLRTLEQVIKQADVESLIRENEKRVVSFRFVSSNLDVVASFPCV